MHVLVPEPPEICISLETSVESQSVGWLLLARNLHFAPDILQKMHVLDGPSPWRTSQTLHFARDILQKMQMLHGPELS